MADPKVSNPSEGGDELPEEKIEGGGDSPAESKKIEGENEAEKDKQEEIPDDVEIATRNRPSLHNQQGFAMRKNKQVEKLKPEDEGGESDNQDKGEGDENNELTDEARKQIGSEVAKHLAPITDEQELGKLFTSEPEAKKYEKLIRKYMAHPAYQDIPPDVIYHHIAFANAAGVGAKKRQDADREAGHSRTGGHTRRPASKSSDELPSAEDMLDMSNEDFEQLQHQARTGKFVK